MDVRSDHHPHATAAVASNPGQQQQAAPTHLIVMVNGLWGFQSDWNKMKQALHAADTQGNCLIHVSGVNTGARTYDGEQQHYLRNTASSAVCRSWYIPTVSATKHTAAARWMVRVM
jgi:hypothetical protein